MLSLQIAGRSIDLPDDFAVTMNLKSPIFGEVGSYSYPFRIPNTPKNAIQLGFRHRVENTTDIYQEDNGVFLWNGLNLFQGTVKLKSMNSKTFEGSIFEGEGDFYYSLKSMTLQQIDFGTITFNNESEKLAYINGCKNLRYPARNIAFPQVKNPSYFDALPSIVNLLYFNYYYQGTIYNTIDPTGEYTVIVPMLYLQFMLKTIFAKLNYSFEDSFFATDSEYSSLVMYNSVDCNSRFAGFFTYNIDRLFLNYHVPRLTMNDFFTGLETFFNIRFFVNTFTRSVRVFSVSEIINAPGYVEFSNHIVSLSTDPEEKITGWGLKMEMDTEDEIFAAIELSQKAILDNLQQSVQSIADLPQWPAADAGEVRYVYDANQFYQLQTNRTWISLPNSIGSLNLLTELIYKNKDQSISTKFSTLATGAMESMDDVGIVGNAMANWKDVSPKVMFVKYRNRGGGWTEDVGLCYTVNKNLFYNGDNGLFNKHYKPFFDFMMATKPVKIVKQMTFTELKEFDFTQKYMINGVKYLVKSIQVTIKMDRILPATLECYTCS